MWLILAMMEKNMLRYFYFLVISVCTLSFAGCGIKNTPPGEDSVTKELFAMDTYMSLTAYGDNAGEAVREAEDKIHELDRMLSAGNEKSEVSILNREGISTFSDDSINILKKSLEINAMTDGAFNPAIYPVMELWGFASGNYRVPGTDEINDVLAHTDVSCINISGSDVTVSDGTKVDFGGIAKGYTSSVIMRIFEQCGVTSGIVNLGGNVQTLGEKPDGSLWRTAIRHPVDDGYIGVVNVQDKAVITSGGYERYFEEDGKRYHHIIDPSTGAPSESGLLSVTVISSDGTLADGLSTALFVMGSDGAEGFWREHSEEFDFIIMDGQGKIKVSEGVSGVFESEYDYEVVKR